MSEEVFSRWQDPTIERLQQENQQLTERYLLLEDKCIDLKDVIEEVRKEVENSSLEVNTREYGTLTVCDSDNILQILDKAKGENNG